eukprot:g4256.t1
MSELLPSVGNESLGICDSRTAATGRASQAKRRNFGPHNIMASVSQILLGLFVVLLCNSIIVRVFPSPRPGRKIATKDYQIDLKQLAAEIVQEKFGRSADAELLQAATALRHAAVLSRLDTATQAFLNDSVAATQETTGRLRAWVKAKTATALQWGLGWERTDSLAFVDRSTTMVASPEQLNRLLIWGGLHSHPVSSLLDVGAGKGTITAMKKR